MHLQFSKKKWLKLKFEQCFKSSCFSSWKNWVKNLSCNSFFHQLICKQRGKCEKLKEISNNNSVKSTDLQPIIVFKDFFQVRKSFSALCMYVPWPWLVKTYLGKLLDFELYYPLVEFQLHLQCHQSLYLTGNQDFWGESKYLLVGLLLVKPLYTHIYQELEYFCSWFSRVCHDLQ